MKHFLSPFLAAIFFLFPGLVLAESGAYSGTYPGISVFDPEFNSYLPVPATLQGRAAVKAGWKTVKAVKPLPVKEWTVMVFVNCKNDLEQAGLYSVNEMEKVGSTKDVNVVVEMGRMKVRDGSDGGGDDWAGERRYLIEKDADPRKVSSPVLMSAEAVDQGDYKQAADFVKWAKVNFPARHYMFVIWNHGLGFLDPWTKRRGVSLDAETGNYVRTPQLGFLLQEAGKIDVLAFDACLMQMPEVAFEVGELAEVMVASEDALPAYGLPYKLFFEALTRHPRMGAEEAGSVMVEAFRAFYEEAGRYSQLSAIRTSKLDDLAERISRFARLARETADLGALKAARDGVIRYDVCGKWADPEMTSSFYGDLSQFARLVSENLAKYEPPYGGYLGLILHGRESANWIEGRTGVEMLKAQSAELQEFIAKELVINNTALFKNRVGRELSESGGISVYLPPVESIANQSRLENIFETPYTDLAFDKATGWHEFVTFLYGVK
ncbi:MAG: clostripain-related cysteine peptidase [Elusimicrobiales bacterium]